MAGGGVLDQVLALAALERDGLASLGASQRVETFAGLIDREPAARRWLGQLELLDPQEIDAAAALAFRASLARGDIGRAAPLAEADPLADLIRSARVQDWDEVIRQGEALSAEAQGYSEVLLLVGAARIYRLDGHRGEAMIDQAMARLRTDGDLWRPSFWAVANLVAGDAAMFARITAALDPEWPPPAPPESAIASPARPPVSRRVKRRLAGLLRRVSMFGARTSSARADEPSAEASTQAAAATFTQGRIEQALSLQRQANSVGKPDEANCVFSARVCAGEALRQDPSTVELATLAEGGWAVELRHAELWGGEDPFVLTANRSVILDGLRCEPASVIGRPGGVLWARSGADEVLVDLTGRPAPWRALEPSVLIGGADDDDGWLLDCLPKLEVWRRSGLGAGIAARLLVRHDLTPRQAESLRLFGVAPRDLVRMKAYGTPRYDRLIVPSLAPVSLAVDMLRARLLTEGPAVPGDSVYLTNLDGMVDGEIALISALNRIGTTVVRPCDHSFPALTARLACARAVVVAPSTAVAPLAFCSPGAPVIHLGEGDDRARAIAHHLGLTYETLDHRRGTHQLLAEIAERAGARP